MKPITIYIMVADSQVKNFLTAIESVGDIIEKFILLSDRDLANAVKGCKTDWYMYMFSDEVLDEGLKAALPIFIDQGCFDVLIMYGKQVVNGEDIFGRSPRLFKRGVELKGMMPLKVNELTLETVLDGFVEQRLCKG